MEDCKVGMRVRRISGSHNGMKEGDTGVITRMKRNGPEIDHQIGTHSPWNLEFVEWAFDQWHAGRKTQRKLAL